MGKVKQRKRVKSEISERQKEVSVNKTIENTQVYST